MVIKIFSSILNFLAPVILYISNYIPSTISGPTCQMLFIFLFFEIKGRSTATSYKKKKHSYITRRSEHHHHTNNAPNKTLHHHKLGDEAKEAAANCAVVANVVPRQKP